MTDIRKAMEQALGPIDKLVSGRFTYFKGNAVGHDIPLTREDVESARAAIEALREALAQQGEQPSFSDYEVFAMQEQKQRAEVHRDKLLSMLEEMLDALGCGDSAIETEASELIDEINKEVDRS